MCMWLIHCYMYICTNTYAISENDPFRLDIDMETLELELYWAKVSDMGLSHLINEEPQGLVGRGIL